METNTATELYKPAIAKNLDNSKAIRVGIQGWPGTGKTHSALTFPNPLVLDFDNNLTQKQRKECLSIPFWNPDFVSKDLGLAPKRTGCQPNRRDALLKFLKSDGQKFTEEQTLIFDSWTAIQEAIDDQNYAEPVINAEGKEDTRAFWGNKLSDSKELMSVIRGLKCNVVILFHEMAERDPKTGQLLDKIRPLQQGKFISELAKNFTFFFRAITEETKDRITGAVTGVKYFWQVESDNTFEAIARPKLKEGLFKIDPTYQELIKHIGL